MLSVIKEELVNLKEQYSDERKTLITEAEGDVRMEDLIPNDGCVVTITDTGFIKRPKSKNIDCRTEEEKALLERARKTKIQLRF